MTNLEFIKTLNLEELADYYCHLHDTGTVTDTYCDKCPFTDLCGKGGAGVKNWLMQEHKVDKYGW